MKKLLKKFGVGKRQKIRQLRRQENLEKINPTYDNPYFKTKKKVEENTSFWQWFLKSDGWAYIGIIVIIFGSIGYLVVGTNYFVIKNINITGTKNISEDSVRNSVNQFLESRKFFILPCNNYLIFKETNVQKIIEENIGNNFALENLSVEKKWPDTININLNERLSGLTWISNDKKYYIDLEGTVSQKIKSDEEVNTSLPLIYDNNNMEVDLNRKIISVELINYTLEIAEKISNVGLEIENFFIPKIECQEQQYKAEKIITNEIEETENKEIKNKKKDILEQYNQGEITVDESLELLETVKKEEQQEANVNLNEDIDEYITWELSSVPKECDYIVVNKEVNVKVKDGFDIYFNSELELNQQLIILDNFLKQTIDNKNDLEYIDLRYKDRIYYK